MIRGFRSPKRVPALLAAVLALAAAPAPAPAQAGQAQTLTIPVASRGSARLAFREAFGRLGALRDVRLRSAFADTHDRLVQGSFTASFGGRPVSGVLIAAANGPAVAAFDAAARAPRTIPEALRRIASGGRRAAAPPARALHRVDFGTGSIALPDSWSVANAYQGCVEAVSRADHGYLAFGCAQAALAPPLLPGTNPRQVLVITSADPVRALAQYLTAPMPAGLGVSDVRIAETKPVQATANGRAAYVLFDYAADGARYRGLALVNLAAVDGRSFMLYKSMFMTPAASFPELAPVLWKSWQSWGVNGNVLSSRLFAAAQTMRETGDLITGSYWQREHVQDRTALAYDQRILDQAQLENVWTGERWNGSWMDFSSVVAGDPSTYRIVPVEQLQP